MTRKPDEIMRELKDPIHVHYHHGDREPHMTPIAMVDLEQLHADALALIQRLDRTIVDQEKLAKKIYEQKVEAENKIVKLEERVKQLETERDAAVADLKACVTEAAQGDDFDCCFACKYNNEYGGCDRPNYTIEACGVEDFDNKWTWRGVTKEG